MKQPSLFDGEEDEVEQETPVVRDGEPRLVRPDREQIRMVTLDVDALVSRKHRVRDIWRFVASADLETLYAPIKSRGDGPGRPATDRRILLTLWLYGTSKGIGSARELARLCTEHDVYRWICGGVRVNYHTLSDFRSERGDAFEDLLAQLLASLRHAGLLKGKRIAQDGVKVRADAGAASFHREASLEKCLEEARAEVAKAKKARANSKRDTRKAAAALRAAEAKEKQHEAALDALKAIRTTKRTKTAKAEARASSTDPDARRMRMADGGFRPAYNVQLATDVDSRLIVGVAATNSGVDLNQIDPMLDKIEAKLGGVPKELLVDGGYVSLDDMDKAAKRKVKVFAPVPPARKDGADPYAPKPTDSDQTKAWRKRMKTSEAQEIYLDRGATAETVNADLRAHRGFTAVPVRGLAKVQSVALLMALSYDVLRAITLGALT